MAKLLKERQFTAGSKDLAGRRYLYRMARNIL
jgi:hypothetical protein